MNDNGWSEYKREVIGRLDDQAARMEKIEAALLGLQVEVAKLQVKAGAWGFLAGAIAVGGAWVIRFLK